MSKCYESTLIKKSSKGSYNHTQDIKKSMLLCNDTVAYLPSVECSVEHTDDQRVYAKSLFIKKSIKH